MPRKPSGKRSPVLPIAIGIRYSPLNPSRLSSGIFSMFFVYILFSAKLNRYYVGSTNNIDARLENHLKGISRYTSQADDWILTYKESFENRSDAIKRENEIKRKKSRKYIEYLIQKGAEAVPVPPIPD
jgi:putative endonuclease